MVEYPVGHRRRREEGIPLLWQKAADNLATCLPADRCAAILDCCADQAGLEQMPVQSFIDLFVLDTEPSR